MKCYGTDYDKYTALDWTMGETVVLRLMLKKDSMASVAWDDGKV